jgi:glutaminase
MPEDMSATRSPFQSYLAELHARFRDDMGGAVADYIPELAKAPPGSFGLAIATVDGQVYTAGDALTPFSIQSISKPFMYGDALKRLGNARLLKKVGVEPTGEAFNSIVLDEVANRPFNPMVNAGAIAISALIDGTDQDARLANMRAVFDRFAGRELGMDEQVYYSEAATGHRNRAIAWLMLNSGMIDRPPEEVLEVYFQQCSVEVTCADLALMGATLANQGVQPRTGEVVLKPEHVRDVLTLMMSCGMYDYAGEWSFEVGLPAKSGVSGGVLAVLPGQLAFAVWSPPLDPIGNSVRGIKACRAISEDFGLHMFLNAPDYTQVLRRTVRGGEIASLKTRSADARKALSDAGSRLAVLELQGLLCFASAERVVRRLQGLSPNISHLILDFRRVNEIDRAAGLFLAKMLEARAGAGVKVAVAELSARGEGVANIYALEDVERYPSADAALEAAEDEILASLATETNETRFALEQLDLFDGLATEDLRALEDIIQPFQFAPGQMILKAGDPATLFFVIARGTVSVRLPGAGNVRIGGMGPGQFFGEMALLEGGARSADVVAEENVICLWPDGGCAAGLRGDPARDRDHRAAQHDPGVLGPGARRHRIIERLQ